MFDLLIKDGNFKEWVRIFFLVVGIFSVVLGIEIGIGSTLGCIFFLVGFLFAAVGGYSAQAHMLKLKPFNRLEDRLRNVRKEDEGEN